MNLEIFIRNVQLAKLGIGELDDDEKKIYNFLVDNLSNLQTFISDKNPDSLYFGKNRESLVLSYNSKNETLYINNKKIWSFFRDDLSIEPSDIATLIKWWVGVELDLKPKDISGEYPLSLIRVGVELDLKPKDTEKEKN